MYYVYLLKSKKKDFIYIGSTPDVKRRLLEHDEGKVKSTKYYTPLQLVYYEAFLDKNDALDREHKLKHHGSVIGHLKKRLKNSLH
ncbi:MAG: GIY-YIG nuclease family protein [Cytophagales bacterium]|nr:GIY-YIG nuclease family protein [Cytophagales bacterium]